MNRSGQDLCETPAGNARGNWALNCVWLRRRGNWSGRVHQRRGRSKRIAIETATERQRGRDRAEARNAMRCGMRQGQVLGVLGWRDELSRFWVNLESVSLVLLSPKVKSAAGGFSVFSGVNLEGGRRWRTVIG